MSTLVDAPAAKADLRRAQQIEGIVEGALRALRTYGYAGASLARIAEEASTSKRMVLHYFGSREGLFEVVVRRIGRRILGQVEQAVADQPDPSRALSDGLDRLWQEILDDPGLHAVFFGLLAESVTDASLGDTIRTVRGGCRSSIARMIAASQSIREPLTDEELESSSTLVLATIAGLTMDVLERGETPALHRAHMAFKRCVGASL